MNKISSYTSANAFPIKVIRHRLIPDRKAKIAPIHIQLNPTNKCNLSCSFCSCANRNKTLEIDFEKLKDIMISANKIGCEAVTITGGGEPLLYSKINELIEFLNTNLGIEIGLVTNGTQFSKLYHLNYDLIRWIRISHSDEREFDTDYQQELANYIEPNCDVDWAFSYVISQTPNLSAIAKIVKFANEYNFTHVRIVSDLLAIDQMPSMNPIREFLSRSNIPDDKVIYQGRKEFVHGREKCLISLLKPVIGADGKLYGCCGSQYSQKEPSLDYEESTCMGDAEYLRSVYESQSHFDGSKCVRCYYDDYNEILEKLINDIDHESFV